MSPTSLRPSASPDHIGRPERRGGTWPRRTRRLAVAVAAVGLVASLGACAPPPRITATTVVSGLTNPWDVAFTPARSMVWTEKSGRIVRRTSSGAVNVIASDMSDLFVGSETGLMGLAIDPAFASNRRIYTCQGWTDGAARDIRVIPWVVNTAGDAVARQAPIVTGLPTTSGRHGGCRLRFDTAARLLIGTGDATIGTAPQSIASLGGKVLRIDRFTGQGISGNPFFSSTDADSRRILSYGHRNVQGLAIRPSSGSIWAVEHGPDRDDEVNRILAGGNYGWNPVPGYNEAVPMTDRDEFPDARPAAWSSGAPTVATSGASWASGERWKGWNDTLVVATLKGESLLVLQPQSDGTLRQIARVVTGFGRLRSVTMGPDNNLYVTTSNGSGDRILRITPS